MFQFLNFHASCNRKNKNNKKKKIHLNWIQIEEEIKPICMAGWCYEFNIFNACIYLIKDGHKLNES